MIIGIHSASEVEKNVDLLITQRPQSVNYIAVRMVNRAHVRTYVRARGRPKSLSPFN